MPRGSQRDRRRIVGRMGRNPKAGNAATVVWPIRFTVELRDEAVEAASVAGDKDAPDLVRRAVEREVARVRRAAKRPKPRQ